MIFLRGVDIAYPQRVASGGLIKRVSDNKVLADIREMEFVCIKATQGTTIRDAQWDNSYAMARKFGKKVIAYHFNDSRVPVAAQVDWFLKVAPEADAYAIDQEGEFGFSDAQTQAFVDLMRAAGKTIGHYHSASGFGGVQADFEWVADYRLESLEDGTTTVPGWDIWQFSSEGGPDGAGLDLDYMRADSPIAVALGLDVVNRVAADAARVAAVASAVAPLNARIATLTSDLDATRIALGESMGEAFTLRSTLTERDATIATLNAEAAALRAALDAAPAAERARVAKAAAAQEEARVNAL